MQLTTTDHQPHTATHIQHTCELGQIFQRFYLIQITTYFTPICFYFTRLGRAKDIWTHKRNSGFFDGTYLATNPQIWSEPEQQIGLACATHLREHILLKCHGQMTYSPTMTLTMMTPLWTAQSIPWTHSRTTLMWIFCQLIDQKKH